MQVEVAISNEWKELLKGVAYQREPGVGRQEVDSSVIRVVIRLLVVWL